MFFEKQDDIVPLNGGHQTMQDNSGGRWDVVLLCSYILRGCYLAGTSCAIIVLYSVIAKSKFAESKFARSKDEPRAGAQYTGLHTTSQKFVDKMCQHGIRCLLLWGSKVKAKNSSIATQNTKSLAHTKKVFCMLMWKVCACHTFSLRTLPRTATLNQTKQYCLVFVKYNYNR